MLTKTILNVAYKDKDEVKKLGAKWDPQQKVWYVPAGKDPKIFKHWLSKPDNKPELTIRMIGLVRNMVSCWSCKGYCTVYAIYARNVGIVNTKENNHHKNGFFILTEISKIADPLADFLILRCPNFRLGKASTAGIKLYRNHCDHCKIGFSDLRLHKKGLGFNPNNIAACKAMQFIDLLFFDALVLNADFIDYTDNDFFKNQVVQVDYLTDFI